jgi:hypothetical protein
MKRIVVAILALLVTASLFAHGGGHVKGTIEKISSSAITVKQLDGNSISLPLNEKTKFYAGDLLVTAAEASSGSRVIIHRAADGSVAIVRLPPRK